MHSSATLEAFTDGETRLVYAARKDDPGGRLVLLQDGEAEQMRAYTKAQLQCFVPDCPSAAFTTVARRGKRDGFRHLTAGNHAPESLFHQQGKARLLDWLAETAPEVHAKAEVPLDAAATRRADVMATFPDGARLAFEVQYADIDVAGTPKSWTTRTTDYAAAGVAVVWLFGHHGPQVTMREDRIWLNAVQRAALQAGLPLFWLNPTTGKLAVPYVTVTADGEEFTISPPAGTQEVRVWVDDLADFTLTPAGLTGPRLTELAAPLAAYLAAVERERAREAEARRRANEARQYWEREAAKAREKAVETELERRRKLQGQVEAWRESAMRKSVLAAHGEFVPDYLNLPAPEGVIDAYHQHWQAMIYGFVMRNQVGQTKTLADCMAVLREHQVGYQKHAGEKAVRTWLQHLHDAHRIRLDPHSKATFLVTDPTQERVERPQAEAAAARQRVQRLEEQWRRSPARRRVIELFGDVPRCVTTAPSAGGDTGVEALDEHWRCIVVLALHANPDADLRLIMESIASQVRVTSRPRLRDATTRWLQYANRNGLRKEVKSRRPAPVVAPPIVLAPVPAGLRAPEPPDGTCVACGRTLAGVLIAGGWTTHVGECATFAKLRRRGAGR